MSKKPLTLVLAAPPGVPESVFGAGAFYLAYRAFTFR